jgi:hypothetical protein
MRFFIPSATRRSESGHPRFTSPGTFRPRGCDLLDGLLLRTSSDRGRMPLLGFKANGVQLAALFCSRDSVLRRAFKPRGVGGSNLQADQNMPFPGSRGQPSILRSIQSLQRAVCTTHLSPFEGLREAGTTGGLMAETVAIDEIDRRTTRVQHHRPRSNSFARNRCSPPESTHQHQRQTWSFDPTRSTPE